MKKNVWKKGVMLLVCAMLVSFSLISGVQAKSAAAKSPTKTPTITPTPQPTATVVPGAILMGADMSYVNRVLNKGITYKYANGTSGDAFAILKSYGADIVRLRVWNNPASPETWCNEADVLNLATKAKNAGLKIYVDFHYSDSWADPSHQTKPAAWNSYTYAQLQQAVYDYSRLVVNDLIAQGTPPDYVEIGNEITHGMLWPDGQVGTPGSSYDTDAQWTKFAGLVTSGINGVKSTGSTAKIVIHIDQGGQSNDSDGRWFFDKLVAKGVQFDVIALSYYYTWHGPISVLSYNLNDLKTRYGKETMVAEASYPWTLNYADWTNNVIGLQSQLDPAYPATAAGQQAGFQAVVNAAKTAGASSVFYWGGEWITTVSQDASGSTWENQTLWDFNWKAIPQVMSVFTNN